MSLGKGTIGHVCPSEYCAYRAETPVTGLDKQTTTFCVALG
jgi:hypothetical protein